ncbi:MAG: DUF4332 domain-containing protein [Myxococcales bacterium]|nr:DUF4332 domain-containing protein [Myxococcota bacterium]MDW8280352.1 DUF4332 domain-containing protein [Myxococcales bacterium]
MIARLAMVVAVLLAVPALGSNYFLDQIVSVASRSEIRRLKRAGVRTTDELARRGATPQGRTELHRRTGISLSRLSYLSSLADLMRLRGIGPDAARVLVAAGCRSVAELQQADPYALAEVIQRVNDRARLSTNPPRAENLQAWIAQARQMVPLYTPDS